LKLENIVFENERPDSIVKLIDFGVSLVYTPDDELTERVGTIYTMSPETMKGHYSSQADLWSLGVCTYMLLANGTQPFDASTNKEIVHKVLQGDYSMSEPANLWAGISEDAKSFVRSLLVVDPTLRATATTAIQDQWLMEHHSQRLTKGDVMDEATKERVRASILQYASTGDFVKLALNVIAKKSTGQEIEEIRALFDEFDQDQSGTLNLEEFKAFFNEQNQYSEEYVKQIFHQIVRVLLHCKNIFNVGVTHVLCLSIDNFFYLTN
jgi:calcium-dependent protein kinase